MPSVFIMQQPPKGIKMKKILSLAIIFAAVCAFADAKVEAWELMKLCPTPVIDKTRYLVDFGGHTFEVDEFYGDNEGLVVAEIELETPDEYFEKPSFLGKEVTGEGRYYNSSLSRFPYKCW